MDLYRLQIRPCSSWTTPWQADTLWGMLCWVIARHQGADVLRKELIEPALDGHPPFVLSDACPDGWLPVPLQLKSAKSLEYYRLNCPQSEQTASVKSIRKSKWITVSGFQAYLRGEWPDSGDFASINPLRLNFETHNQIGRDSNTTSNGGNLFSIDSWQLRKSCRFLNIYFRATADGYSLLLSLMKELSMSGFGADVSNGKGEFEILDSRLADEFPTSIPAATECIVISTFQPSLKDPKGICWELFSKYGKLGPDFGIDNVFKRPLLMCRPGASFSGPSEWLGWAIPAARFLSGEVVAKLESQGNTLIHPAFGLAMPVSKVLPT